MFLVLFLLTIPIPEENIIKGPGPKLGPLPTKVREDVKQAIALRLMNPVKRPALPDTDWTQVVKDIIEKGIDWVMSHYPPKCTTVIGPAYRSITGSWRSLMLADLKKTEDGKYYLRCLDEMDTIYAKTTGVYRVKIVWLDSLMKHGKIGKPVLVISSSDAKDDEYWVPIFYKDTMVGEVRFDANTYNVVTFRFNMYFYYPNSKYPRMDTVEARKIVMSAVEKGEITFEPDEEIVKWGLFRLGRGRTPDPWWCCLTNKGKVYCVNPEKKVVDKY